MTETAQLAYGALAGVVLGLIFFGGLYLTVTRALAADIPALWFAASMLLRTAIALYGFYWISGGDWRRLIAAVAGFYVARTAIARLTRDRGHSCT